MGRYDNYSNARNIKDAQKKLDKLTRKRKPDLYKIELAKEELKVAKLFESCQIFKSIHKYGPNERVLFSDDNNAMWFFDEVIRYEDIQSYSIVEKIVSGAYTVTKSNGAVSRAIMGHVIAGDMGAIVGAISAGSRSETTFYQEGRGFIFQVFTKDGLRHYCELPSIRDFSNKIHPKWIELGTKIQRIIDGTN